MFKEIAEKLTGKNKIILVHGNADMDAIGSAFAIAACFPPGNIYAPGGIDRTAGQITEKLGITVLEECDLSDYDLVVVVDTSSPEQLKPVDSLPEGSIVIDHHAPTGKWHDVDFICDNTKVSCCELIKDIIDSADIEIPQIAAKAMLGGMLTDSGHFQFADPKMMMAFADLLENSGIYTDEIFGLARSPTPTSERIAVMKTIGRVKFDHVGNMVVATAYGGSFESSSCRALLLAGADVSFVGSQREDEVRISARATQDIVRKGIHLGNVLGDISEETESDGGGHGGAAGFTGTGDVEALLHICMLKTMDLFREIKRKEQNESELT